VVERIWKKMRIVTGLWEFDFTIETAKRRLRSLWKTWKRQSRARDHFWDAREADEVFAHHSQNSYQRQLLNDTVVREMNTMRRQPIMHGEWVGPATIDTQNHVFGARSSIG